MAERPAAPDSLRIQKRLEAAGAEWVRDMDKKSLGQTRGEQGGAA